MAKGTVNVGPVNVDHSNYITTDKVGAANGVAGLDETKKLPADNLPAHATAENTYGAGSGSNYGHVKLSDATDGTSGADGGVAATPKAVKDVAEGAAKKNLSNVDNETLAAKIKEAGAGGTPIVAATSTDGVAYTATVDGVTALETGLEITIIPDKLSTSTTPTLNVNSLGAKGIRALTGYNTAAAAPGAFTGWISAGKPITVKYNGTNWIVTDVQRTSGAAIYGQVPVQNGGWYINSETTDDNKTEALEALKEIGVAEADHTQAASTITAGTFAGQVVANSSGQTPGTSLLRNSKLVSADTNPTVNGEINWTYA